jgi:hypothetical protein
VLAFFMKRVMPVLELVAAYDRHRADAEKKLEAQLATKRAELAASEAKLRELQDRRDRGTGFISNYGDAATGRSPAALLQYFLRESADLAAVRSKLGFVATVRRCFETLQDIMREMRDAGHEGPAAAGSADRPHRALHRRSRSLLGRAGRAGAAGDPPAARLRPVRRRGCGRCALAEPFAARSLQGPARRGRRCSRRQGHGRRLPGEDLPDPFWVRSLQHDGGNAETLLRSIAPTVAPPAAPRQDPSSARRREAPPSIRLRASCSSTSRSRRRRRGWSTSAPCVSPTPSSPSPAG